VEKDECVLDTFLNITGKALADYARKLGCHYLKLNRDGLQLPWFPIYDW